jgi:hypothetical protein
MVDAYKCCVAAAARPDLMLVLRGLLGCGRMLLVQHTCICTVWLSVVRGDACLHLQYYNG